MSDLEDTQELDLSELFGVDDDEVESARKRLPDAAVTRAAVVGVLMFAGAVLGRDDIAHTWVEPIVNAYVIVAPLALAWWIRRHTKGGPTGKHAR